MKRLSKNEFIEKSRKIHDDKYGYSLVEYKNNSTKVKIMCSKHGVFEQTPHNHLLGRRCKLCVNNNIKSTTNSFIEKSRKIHDDKYGYSLVEYKNNSTKVKIMCSKHGVFEQTPNSHLSGKKCYLCDGNIKHTNNSFIEKSRKIHGNKYDYSLIDYKNNKTKIKIICPVHGVFDQKPINHSIQKQGCPMCNGNIKHTNNSFIEKSNNIHSNKYDYSLIDYINSQTKVKIICPIHGIFEQRPNDHIIGKQGCPICNESKGEKEIRNILNENNIKFESQKTFDKCKNKRRLPFDFYLSDYNICIEYDGKQHYKPIDYFGGEKELEKNKIRDKIKNNYCKNNNIKLLRIKYNDNIIDKIKNIIN